MARPVVFLSDFGLDDEFVGVCHGVIAAIAPECRVIDLVHAIPRQDVTRGALLLARSVPYMPNDAVFLAVVDPDVGTGRVAVGVEAVSGGVLLGPNNGVLSLAWESLGGVREARSIEAEDLRLHPTSPTFHGRDVFAPAAAHLAAGVPFERIGPPLDAAALVRVSIPPAETVAGLIRTTVIGIDRFGNVELAAMESDLRDAGLHGAPSLRLESAAGASELPVAVTFGDVEPEAHALIIDSSGWLTIVVNRGSAAERFGLRNGASVELGRFEADRDAKDV